MSEERVLGLIGGDSQCNRFFQLGLVVPELSGPIRDDGFQASFVRLDPQVPNPRNDNNHHKSGEADNEGGRGFSQRHDEKRRTSESERPHLQSPTGTCNSLLLKQIRSR